MRSLDNSVVAATQDLLGDLKHSRFELCDGKERLRLSETRSVNGCPSGSIAREDTHLLVENIDE